MRRSGFRRGFPDRLGGLVKRSLADLGLGHKVMEQQALQKWAQVVGPQIAAATVADKVQDGVMFICCKSSMWCNELTFHKVDIIKKLNAAVGGKVIDDLRFSARGFKKVEQARREPHTTRAKGLDAISIEESEVKAVEKIAESASNPELADKIKKAVLTSKRLQALKRQEGWRECSKCGRLHNDSGDICNLCS